MCSDAERETRRAASHVDLQERVEPVVSLSLSLSLTLSLSLSLALSLPLHPQTQRLGGRDGVATCFQNSLYEEGQREARAQPSARPGGEG